MKIRASGLGLAATALCSLLLAVGCATRTKHEWLCLFFDGVPPEPSAGQGLSTASGPAATTNGAARPLAPKVAAPTVFVHKPYGEDQCDKCHDRTSGQKLRGSVKDVCLNCHTGLLARAKHLHSPAEDGECLQCHAPHQSLQKSLLLRKGKALCYECHDDVTKGKVKHPPAEDGECLECHNPHASDQAHLLRKKGQALCYSCHDAVTKAKNKHAPVEDGDCLSCHRPHASDEPALLKLKGQALCYDCHDQKDVTKQPAHAQIGESACTQCHDPHGSDRQALLKPGAGAPAADKPAAPKT